MSEPARDRKNELFGVFITRFALKSYGAGEMDPLTALKLVQHCLRDADPPARKEILGEMAEAVCAIEPAKSRKKKGERNPEYPGWFKEIVLSSVNSIHSHEPNLRIKPSECLSESAIGKAIDWLTNMGLCSHTEPGIPKPPTELAVYRWYLSRKKASGLPTKPGRPKKVQTDDEMFAAMQAWVRYTDRPKSGAME